MFRKSANADLRNDLRIFSALQRRFKFPLNLFPKWSLSSQFLNHLFYWLNDKIKQLLMLLIWFKQSKSTVWKSNIRKVEYYCMCTVSYNYMVGLNLNFIFDSALHYFDEFEFWKFDFNKFEFKFLFWWIWILKIWFQ